MQVGSKSNNQGNQHLNKTIQFFSKLFGATLLSFITVSVLNFPAFTTILFISLLIYCLFLWHYSYLWLIVLPALLPFFDLTPWTGRILLTEFDLFLLTTIAIALWKNRFSFEFYKQSRTIMWLIAGLTLSYTFSTINGYLQLPNSDNAPFYIYHSSFNSIHISKGFFSALFFLPMLAFEKYQKTTIGRYFSLGMILALGFGILSVIWERLFFAGLFDFSSTYNISGLFSGMLLGGEVFDGFLVLAFPFFVICFYAYRNRFAHFLGLLLFTIGLYSFLVTFTQINYLALAVIFLVLYIGQRKLAQQSLRQLNTFLLLTLISTAVIIPVVGGRFIQQNFNSTIIDLKNKTSHWSDALNIMEKNPTSLLSGMGKGTFPAQYFNYQNNKSSLASFQLHENNVFNFIRFSPSDESGNLFLRQRIPLTEKGQYKVSITLRSFAKKMDKLLVEYCQRSIFPNQPECTWSGFKIPDNKIGQWITIHKTFNSTPFLQNFSSLFKPFEISLINRGLKSKLDIAKVEITTPDAKQIVKNSDFSQNFDHWFFYSGNHLSWHIKNQWVAAFYDGGILELLLYTTLLFLLLKRLYRQGFSSNYYNVTLSASLSGFITIGFFGSPLDDPRIIWLFYLVAWMIIVQPEAIKQENSGIKIPWVKLVITLFFFMLLASAAVFLQLMYTHKISARQLLLEGEKRSGLDSPQLRELLTPTPKFINKPLDGVVKSSHPRILLPELSSWDGASTSPLIKQRMDLYKKNNMQFSSSCHSKNLLFTVSCWLENNETKYAHSAINTMLQFKLSPAKAAGSTSNVWQLALTYDLMHSILSESDKQKIEQKIIQGLKDTLLVLDEESSSLWHTRSTHASIAWIAASVLPDTVENNQLQRRSQCFFINAINALAFTEIWPGGYNYWIQNRAFLFALASSAYVNGLTDTKNAAQIKKIMQNTAYWHIYATRPDNRIEGYGDEGSRIDLKDETRRFIDLVAQLNQDPILSGYSYYLAKLHGRESYYRGYRWGFLLFNDPTITRPGDGTLESLGQYLPKSRIFGKKSTNSVYMRSGWGKDDTFISFKAGHSFSHHGHYDAGHFTLFKSAPLATNSSNYGGIKNENRLNYSIRTIAKNSLLIVKPGEKVQPNRFFKNNISDGGQRITQPTGSSLLNIEHWLNNYQQNAHFESADLQHYRHEPQQYTFISVDLTPAYNNTQYDENNEGGKVSKVIRNLLYLPQEDHLIIYDQINSTQAEYKKKWLLHTVNRPKINNLKVLKGSLGNGISESASSHAQIINGRGFLQVTKLLPENASLKLIGGKDYQYYVETDGDDTVIDGKNFNQDSTSKKWDDTSFWRLEISPEKASIQDDFLMVLSPSLDQPRQEKITPATILSGDAAGVTASDILVVFAHPSRHKKIIIEIENHQRELIIIGAANTQIKLFDQLNNPVFTKRTKKTVFSLNINNLNPTKLEISR